MSSKCFNMLPAIEIKEKAKEIGFDACGIAQVAAADSEALFFDRWLKEGNHAGMAYMENHREIRLNPAGLVEGAKTVISVALNYYPEQKLPPEAPHIAYYAYGKDYHLVVKEITSLDFLSNTLSIKNSNASTAAVTTLANNPGLFP